MSDPIFAALDAHKDAWNEYGNAASGTDAVSAKKSGRRITSADRERNRVATHTEQEKLIALVSTAPTTIGGLMAALQWFHEMGDDERTGAFIETVIRGPHVAIATAHPMADFESMINDVKGSATLLDEIWAAIYKSARVGPKRLGHVDLTVTDEQICALSFAHSTAFLAVQELDKAFYSSIEGHVS